MHKSWEELKEACKNCTRCELCKTRSNVVFGVGNEKSDIMFIGEGPGENEDLQGEPFVGRGGQLLDKMLKAVDLDRGKNIYIANIVKCRPPNNRDPFKEEKEACIVWLMKQIELINPKIIVCLGRIAAMELISPELKITRDHGVFYKVNGRIMMATLHPAALLRNPNNKPGAFEDFIALQGKIAELRGLE